MNNKKFICLLLAVCLCAGMLPMVVLAGNYWNNIKTQTSDYSKNGTPPKITITQTFDPNNNTITLKATNQVSYPSYGALEWFVNGEKNKDKLTGNSFESLNDGQNVADATYVFVDSSNSPINDDELTINNVTKDMNGIEIMAAYVDSSHNIAGSDNFCANITLDVSSISGGLPGATANGMGLAGPYIYDEEIDVMMTPDEAGHIHEYGDAAYYLLIDEVSDFHGPMSDKDYVDKLKVKVKGWTDGGEIVEGVDVVKCKVDVDAEYVVNNAAYGSRYDCGMLIDYYGCGSGYYYFLKIDIDEKESISETDIIGTVEFNRKADEDRNGNKIGKIDESRHDIEFAAFYEFNWLNPDFPTIVSDRENFEWGNTYALKFDNDEVVELSFGTPNGGNNEGIFEVDVSGQGKILLSYSTDPVEAIAAVNEGADMDFLVFNNAKFNRTGVFTYEMDNGAYAYRIVNGKLVEMPGCYDKSEEAFVFNTNRLEVYVFADRALVNPA